MSSARDKRGENNLEYEALSACIVNESAALLTLILFRRQRRREERHARARVSTGCEKHTLPPQRQPVGVGTPAKDLRV